MTTQRESLFKTRVMRDLEEFFPVSYILKTQEVARRGVPDLICCLYGYFVAIELKRNNKQATKLQQYMLDKICVKANGIAMWTTPETWEKDVEALAGILLERMGHKKPTNIKEFN